MNLTPKEIDLISRTCWSWMETIDPECAEMEDIQLDELEKAVKKLNEKEN